MTFIKRCEWFDKDLSSLGEDDRLVQQQTHVAVAEQEGSEEVTHSPQEADEPALQQRANHSEKQGSHASRKVSPR